ncbi:MAG: type II secretion system F family protein [Myxococcota bacterium]
MPIERAQAARSSTDWGDRLREIGSIELTSERVTDRDRIFFTERLALLLGTGNGLHASLRALEEQAGHGGMESVIRDLQEGVEGGLSFSQALARNPESFPPSFVSVVAAGESGGFLSEVLERLRDLDEKRQELRSTLFSAFSYPAFLALFSVAVVGFVLIVVFPKFGEMFVLIWDQLPVTTRWLMGASEALRQHAWAFLVASVGLSVVAWQALTRPAGKRWADRALTRLPVVRELAVLYRLVQFMHVMSLGLANGVPMLEALRSCRDVVGSPEFRSFVLGLESSVQEGRGVAVGFTEADFVPPLVAQMIETGEESGELATVMGRMADFYEREWKRKLNVISKLIEPMMLAVMGVVVGIIVSSLILPIFKLSTTVR